MLRLIRYLKPYTLLILLNIALLFVQANADLALPDYLSRIVNNGIQQGGVENAVPQAIRQQQLERLLLFTSAEEQAQIKNAYTLVDPASPDYETYLQQYPALAQQAVYVRKDVSQDEIDTLEPVMAKAILVVSTIEQAMTDPAKAAMLSQGTPFDLSTLPPGTDLFAQLGNLPPQYLSQMKTTIDEKFATLGESMLSQMAVGAVKAEYEALGMDASGLQSNYILRTGGLMLLISLVGGVSTVISGFLSARAAAGMARDVRQDLFKKVESFSSTEFDKFSTASLITRSTNDVTQVQMVIFMILRMVFFAPIIGVGGIIRALNMGASMWWIIAAAVAALVSLIAIIFSISLPKFKVVQSLVDRLNLVTRENLSGMMVIRSFNKQEFEENRFDVANQNLTNNTRWDVQGTESLEPSQWYLVLSNHQSWTDIVVLQRIFHRKIPFLKFFIKKELFWLPLLGQAWWALDFPFIKRYSKAKLQRKPHLRGKDLEITRRACKRFQQLPISIMNFVEGTRFTIQKHRQQQSPYTHLLRPKAGGIAAVLGDDDSIQSHIQDTFVAGAGLCGENATRFVVEHGKTAIEWLIRQGVQFSHDEHHSEELHLTQPALSRMTETGTPSEENRPCAASRMAGEVSGVVIRVRRLSRPRRTSMAIVRDGSSFSRAAQALASSPSGVTMHRAPSCGD